MGHDHGGDTGLFQQGRQDEARHGFATSGKSHECHHEGTMKLLLLRCHTHRTIIVAALFAVMAEAVAVAVAVDTEGIRSSRTRIEVTDHSIDLMVDAAETLAIMSNASIVAMMAAAIRAFMEASAAAAAAAVQVGVLLLIVLS